jgi:hypothetical protein
LLRAIVERWAAQTFAACLFCVGIAFKKRRVRLMSQDRVCFSKARDPNGKD